METNTTSPEQTFSSGSTGAGGGEGVSQPTGTSGNAEGASSLPPAAPQSQPGITPEMIQRAVQEGANAAVKMHQANQPARQEPRRELTAEEQGDFDRQFGVVRVTPEVFRNIMGVAPQGPEQLKALETMLHQTAKQAIAMSTFAMQQQYKQDMDNRFGQLDQRLNPVFNAYQQQEFQRVENEFLTANADLKDHAALVREVALATKAQVDAGQLRFTSRQESIKFVADKARSLLNVAAPAGNTAASRSSGPTRNRMTPTSMGGSPGSNRPSQPGNTVSITPKDVFGDMG